MLGWAEVELRCCSHLQLEFVGFSTHALLPISPHGRGHPARDMCVPSPRPHGAGKQRGRCGSMETLSASSRGMNFSSQSCRKHAIILSINNARGLETLPQPLSISFCHRSHSHLFAPKPPPIPAAASNGDGAWEEQGCLLPRPTLGPQGRAELRVFALLFPYTCFLPRTHTSLLPAGVWDERLRSHI